MTPSRGKYTEYIFARPVSSGVVFWMAFSVLAVALRGVRWDENYEFAQVILGWVPYPPDHPLAQYVSRFFSGQTYSLAAGMALWPGPLMANGLRNLLFLVATVLPVFLLAAHLARRAVWGHVAVGLVLMGIHIPFYSTYPVQVWPSMYSNGHIGQGAVLLASYLILAGHYRSGYVLFGLLPAIHLGQFPPLVLFVGLRALWRVQQIRLPQGHPEAAWRELNTAWRWALCGILATIAFWAIQRTWVLPPPVASAYYSVTPPANIYHAFMMQHASHRFLPWGTGHIVLVGFVLLATAAARRELRDGTPCGPVYWLGVYGGLAATIVWGTMAVQSWLGPDMPQGWVGWMPYRLMNYVAPLLIPLIVAILASAGSEKRGAALLILAMLFGVLRPALSWIIPNPYFARYFASGEIVFFALFGAACTFLAWDFREDKEFLRVWAMQLALGLAVLGIYHQYGAACVILGTAAAAVLIGRDRLVKSIKLGVHHPLRAQMHTNTPVGGPGRPWSMNAAMYAVFVVLLTVLLVSETLQRQHLPVTPFERQVRAYLAEQGDQNAMVLVRHQQETLQARLGHPVMTDMATITWIPYQPALGPSLDKMYRELYGIDLGPRDGQSAEECPWFEVWPAKSRADWQRLGREYDFHYVLAPAFMTLDLPRVVQGDSDHLYRIPE